MARAQLGEPCVKWCASYVRATQTVTSRSNQYNTPHNHMDLPDEIKYLQQQTIDKHSGIFILLSTQNNQIKPNKTNIPFYSSLPFPSLLPFHRHTPSFFSQKMHTSRSTYIFLTSHYNKHLVYSPPFSMSLKDITNNYVTSYFYLILSLFIYLFLYLRTISLPFLMIVESD